SPTLLVPAWQIISGADQPVPFMQFDVTPFGPPSAFADVFLLSSNNPSHYPVFGKFSLLLYPVFGQDPSSGAFAQSTASILQTGDIPSDARSIHFVNFLSTIESRVNGTLIPLDYETDPRYGFLANVSGDISAY